MEKLFQDLRYGMRMLVKKPGFTLIAVLTLALGTGANTAIFSLVNAVLLKPLPFFEPERLVMVWEDRASIGFPIEEPAPGTYTDWKTQNQVFDDIAMLDWRDFNLTGDGEPEKIWAYGITTNLFSLLGTQPALGRNFLPEEDKPDGPKVTILSHALWQRRYGGDPGILNHDILLNGQKYTVVGVMPAGFQFLQRYIGLWVPSALTQEDLANRDSHYLTVVARMKPGVTIEQANADIKAVTGRIAQAYPDKAENMSSVVLSMREQLTGEIRNSIIMLAVAVGFVLLIACANIASLLLSRATARRKEIAVRTALGASRSQIIRQLLTESVLLAGLGGAVGLLFALWSFAALRQLIPKDMLLMTSLKIDLPVLGYAMAVSFITGIIFGLIPAVQASKVDLNEALKQSGTRTNSSAAGGLLRGAFVVAEVAFAIVLLVSAGLLIQTVFNLQGQYSVFQPDKLLTMRTALPASIYEEHAKRVAFYDQVLERVNALPGVTSAGYTTSIPLQWKGGATGFKIEGRQPEPGVALNAIHRQVSADYLQTIGMSLRQGRYFDEHDNQTSMPVAIINETMARQYWPDEDPLDKRFKLAAEAAPWLTIVGVVADVRQMGMDVAVKAEMYLPYRQTKVYPWFMPRDLVIRTTGNPENLTAAARQEIHAVDPDQPISNVATMEKLLSAESGPRRLGMILLATFAGLALLLASLGIYGVLSYLVAQQTPEIGVRLALGAQTSDILRLVIGKGMTWALLGVAIGSVAAFALTRLMASLLFGVSATDPLTFALVAGLLMMVALVACYTPARRAMKVDPCIALRYE
ncbi:MAG TPA: ABC transporter permease [Blastocatellia bacterium]|nr:ABC transporter permease [Blastocatellia bacterium]